MGVKFIHSWQFYCLNLQLERLEFANPCQMLGPSHLGSIFVIRAFSDSKSNSAAGQDVLRKTQLDFMIFEPLIEHDSRFTS